ncbi:Nuclear transport factor 2 [Arabidopsis suecica]|uniref:Nuclear transport factor 2 n=1 Tax=Arabidopsis suecica TaxID=45249 RepID=A0A8T2FTA1_ARASU|nr:Nuclear transport factor 2 [Arabidopsis suecica]
MDSMIKDVDPSVLLANGFIQSHFTNLNTSEALANCFLQSYFLNLGVYPEVVQMMWYADDSVMTRPGPDGTMMSFTSPEAIQEQIVSCDYEGASFDVMSFAAQSCNTSSEDGAFIMVTGFLTCKDKQVRRRFVQSLYLARRQDRSYAIVNDFLRYIDSIPALPSVPESAGFVKVYYELPMREELGLMYVNESIMSRPTSTSGRTMVEMPGLDAINKRVSNEHKRASNFILNSVDYQICRSFKDRMFIMVCGFVTLDDKTERKFLQFFYVTRCHNGSYVIYNDILRYVDVTPRDTLESSSQSAAKPSTDVELPYFMVKKGKLLSYFNNIDTQNYPH